MNEFSTQRLLLFLSAIVVIIFASWSIASAAQLKLLWNANTEPDLSGYKVYYGTASKVYGIPIDIGKVTNCVLTNLLPGRTYFIAVTAYDAFYNESAYSGEVSGVATDATPANIVMTFDTNPSALQMIIDQITYTAPIAFNWPPGSSHTISVPSPQNSSGTQYVYKSWSDAGAQTHSITTPSSSAQYTASFSTTFQSTSPVISRKGWRLKYVDSEERIAENGAAVNGFDGDGWTIWHTQWNQISPPPPHEIQIDLGLTYIINGFRYLPRQNGSPNGRIAQYEFYVSPDGVNWGTPVTSGSFANDASRKDVGFSAKTGRYIRLRALSEVNGNPWTSMAEINVTGTR